MPIRSSFASLGRLARSFGVAAICAGCVRSPPPAPVPPAPTPSGANAENLDPAEMNFLPSIVASARRLVNDVQKESGPLFRRDAHAKAHGCLTADFHVRDDLPEELRTGVFVAGHTYGAWIRFSNGNAEVRPDGSRDARGMAIKLVGVAGPKLLRSRDEANATTQDFLMINHPVFFNRNPEEYESFIRYQSDGSQFGYFFEDLNPLHWRLRELLLGARLLVHSENPLYEQYYSMTAYALGVDASGAGAGPPPYRRAMKYSARGCTPPDHLHADHHDDDYLRSTLAEHFAKDSGCFEFLVQVQDPAHDMPIEDPTVLWKESDAPFQKVATIHIPPQQFDTPDRNAYCENLSFTPWHGHTDHRPLGGLNRIRKAVYEGISIYRHARNGIDVCEPTDLSISLPGPKCP